MTDNLPSINFNDKKIVDTIRKTVAIGATDEEFLMFAELCKASGLNPFKKEVWFIKAGNRPQIMCGINGYLAIANKHSAFDGMEVEVQHDKEGNPICAICKVHRKDRKLPSTGVAYMKEFKKDTPIWKQMPHVMLTKVAKSIALREAFPQELNGLYTEEEMPAEYAFKETKKKEIEVHPVIAKTLEPIAPKKPLVRYEYNLTLIADKSERKSVVEAAQAAFPGEIEVDRRKGLMFSPRVIEGLEEYVVSVQPTPKENENGEDTTSPTL